MKFIIKRHTLNGHTTTSPMWMQSDGDSYVPRIDKDIAARFTTYEDASRAAEWLQREMPSNVYGHHHYEVEGVEV